MPEHEKADLVQNLAKTLGFIPKEKKLSAQ